MVVNSMSYAKYESYKDSGVDWLREIPEHWQLKRLKYVLAERNERSKTGEEPLFMVSQKYGLVVRADYHDKAEIAQSNIDNKIVYKNDLVFNKLKPHLGVFYKSEIDFKGLVSPDYAVYKVKNYIYDMKYLELLFRNPKYIEQFIIRATGIVEGLIRLYTTELFELPVMIPPREEQEKILNFLHGKTAQIDQAIALKQQQIEKLNEYKQIVIQNAVTKGLNPNAPMKNSGVEWIGNIPEHWDVKKNTHLFNKIGSGTTPTSSDLSYYDSGDINWLQTGDLNNDYIVATSRKINQKAMSKFSSLKLYDENSLVIAMYGATIGKVGLLKIKSTTNQACCVLGNSDKVFMKYIFYVMQFAKNHLISNSYGGGQPNINQDMIKNLRIPYPNLQEQEKIANYLDDLNEKIYKTSKGYQTQIDRLKEYKNILINQAVTGKIKI